MESWIDAIPEIVRLAIGVLIGLGIACEVKYLLFSRTTKKEE